MKKGRESTRVMTVALFLSAHRPRWRRNVTQGGKGWREEMYTMMPYRKRREKKKSLQEDDI